jgi:hypothetical protein
LLRAKHSSDSGRKEKRLLMPNRVKEVSISENCEFNLFMDIKTGDTNLSHLCFVCDAFDAPKKIMVRHNKRIVYVHQALKNYEPFLSAVLLHRPKSDHFFMLQVYV